MVALLAAGAVLIGLRQMPLERWLDLLDTDVQSAGAWGVVLFCAAYIVNVLLLLPGGPITAAAGFVFGLAGGTLVVSIASSIAAVIAFALGRRLSRGGAHRRVRDDPRFQRLDAAVAAKGWKIVALLRLSPLLPFSLSNYVYGVSAVRFRDFLWATWAAMLPGIALHVAIGAVARHQSGGGWLERIPLVVSVILTIIVGVIGARWAQATLRETGIVPDRRHADPAGA